MKPFISIEPLGSTELIPIKEHEGQRIVNARDLHEFLESKREFATWIKDRIEKYGFLENQDYTSFDNFVKRETGASVRIEYALTLDVAKELSMVEGNEKGKMARQYFIQCEKKLREAVKPLSAFELLKLQFQAIEEQKVEIADIKKEIKSLKTRPDYYTVVGYASLHGIHVGLKLASKLGKRATTICNVRGITIEDIPDPRFGRVGCYPQDVLDEVFNEKIN